MALWIVRSVRLKGECHPDRLGCWVISYQVSISSAETGDRFSPSAGDLQQIRVSIGGSRNFFFCESGAGALPSLFLIILSYDHVIRECMGVVLQNFAQ